MDHKLLPPLTKLDLTACQPELRHMELVYGHPLPMPKFKLGKDGTYFGLKPMTRWQKFAYRFRKLMRKWFTNKESVEEILERMSKHRYKQHIDHW